MAWGKAKVKAPPSIVSQVFPLVITFAILVALAWVGFQIYQSVVKIQEQASQRMGKKNVVFTKDGVRVGVKHVESEAYVDKTQSWFVKAWNLSGGGVTGEGTATTTAGPAKLHKKSGSKGK